MIDVKGERCVLHIPTCCILFFFNNVTRQKRVKNVFLKRRFIVHITMTLRHPSRNRQYMIIIENNHYIDDQVRLIIVS